MRGRLLLIGALCALLTACGGPEGPRTPETPSEAATEADMTRQDCYDLVDSNWVAGVPADVSDRAECLHLTDDGYAEVVGEVLDAHSDEIREDTNDELTRASMKYTWEQSTEEDKDLLCAGVETFGHDWAEEQLSSGGGTLDDGTELNWDLAVDILEEECAQR